MSTLNQAWDDPAALKDASAPPHQRGSLARITAWLRALPEGDAAAFRYLLLLRFLVLNLVAVALLAAVWLKGWLDAVVAADPTRLVLVIGLVFLAGFASCAHRIAQASAELARLDTPLRHPRSPAARYLERIRGRDGQSRAILASALKLRLAARIASVRHIAGSLVFLGLIGTVVGFIIALSGVEPEQAADVAAIGPMVSTLIQGMSVALYTTLVGAVLNIWLMVNYRLLEGGVSRLFTTIVERGEVP
ncbi:MAG TPA: MotA/TolQ/ExbB proton channel family protein [Geminicoccaceae bacterium]|nr:MotA/TolQ/ExbB proton channel family protein [Geminicoccaceae bacterium]